MGGFAALLQEYISILGDDGFLQSVGFLQVKSLAQEESQGAIITDDDFAALAGSLAMSFIACRVRRLFYC